MSPPIIYIAIVRKLETQTAHIVSFQSFDVHVCVFKLEFCFGDVHSDSFKIILRFDRTYILKQFLSFLSHQGPIIQYVLYIYQMLLTHFVMKVSIHLETMYIHTKTMYILF